MKKWIGLVVVAAFSISCENMFDYSPYETRVSKDLKNLHVDNLNAIKQSQLKETKESFSFAIISDSHYQYKYIGDAIDNIKGRDEVDFVIHGGDMADHGQLKEFEMFAHSMKSLDRPYFTIIGNHDYRANGEHVYEEMYGDFNYSFEYGGCKFVFFDDVFWESKKTPDFDWLEQELSDSDEYKHVFVIAHIPPYTDQFTEDGRKRYRDLMSKNKVSLSIHGHLHRYSYGKFMDDDVDYLVVPSTYKKGYCIVHVGEDKEVELVNL